MAAAASAGDGPFTVVSWSGSYGAAPQDAVLSPFTEATGAEIRTVDYSGYMDGFAERAEREGRDVIDMQVNHAITACRIGLLLKLDYRQIVRTVAGIDPDDDFIDGAFIDCGRTQNIFAAAVAYDDRAFPGVKPSRIDDFFDLKNFPGRYAVQKNPDAILE